MFLTQTSYSINVTVFLTEFSANSCKVWRWSSCGTLYWHSTGHFGQFFGCLFNNNTGVPTQNEATGGGGLAVFTGLTNPLYAHVSLPSNEVIVRIENSHFVGNSATKGGGLFTFSLFDSLPSLTGIPEADTFDMAFILHKCNFLHNAGPYGAALSLQQRISYGYDGKVVALISNVNVSENTHTPDPRERRLFGNADSSAIHLESILVVVHNNFNISDNDMTGIYSSLLIAPNASLSVSRNTGVLGGGVHLLERSPLIVAFPNSNLLFSRNRAMVQGGAIYITPETLSAEDVLLPITSDCFFAPTSYGSGCSSESKCNNFTVLNIRVSFEGNSAPLESIVYGSTLKSCY